ncbi:unnamed protein product [Blepharisma stoltei]|uniref:Uncharacterized protein n=1 Tax=Blepharisma stoltei TaxID=1481888 RepID=A0AAU9JLD3_9CILI|nr:unnamed protein product [Blepharisma stoltei]
MIDENEKDSDSDSQESQHIDPINQLILETLRKKPVNSEYFSVLKRIKPGYRVRQRDKDFYNKSPEAVSERSKNYLTEAGFSYGRFHFSDPFKDQRAGRPRIRAAGPIIDQPAEDLPPIKFNDKFSPKIIEGFRKPSPIIPQKIESIIKTHRDWNLDSQRNESPSQIKAKEYLMYVNCVSPAEKSHLKAKIIADMNSYKKKLEKNADSELAQLNGRGMFSNQINKTRVQAMIAVRLQNKRMSLSPVLRAAKEELSRSKIKQFTVSPIKTNLIEESEVIEHERGKKLLKVIEGAVAKKIVRNKRRKSSSLQDELLYKSEWTEAINASVHETMKHCRPDSRITNLGPLSLNNSVF